MQIQVAFNLLTPSAMAVVDLFLSTKRSSLPFFTIIFSIADASNPSVMIVQADSICRHTFAKNSDMNTRSSQRRWCRRCRRTCPMHTESVHFLRVQQRKPKKKKQDRRQTSMHAALLINILKQKPKQAAPRTTVRLAIKRFLSHRLEARRRRWC